MESQLYAVWIQPGTDIDSQGCSAERSWRENNRNLIVKPEKVKNKNGLVGARFLANRQISPRHVNRHVNPLCAAGCARNRAAIIVEFSCAVCNQVETVGSHCDWCTFSRGSQPGCHRVFCASRLGKRNPAAIAEFGGVAVSLDLICEAVSRIKLCESVCRNYGDGGQDSEFVGPRINRVASKP
jgi:hypothetical protein